MSEPARDMPTLYTDGGASPNPGPGGWGVVLVEDGVVQRELSGGAEHTTNNRMELSAAIAALECQPEGARFALYTDSTYVRNGITKWISGWIRKNWMRGPKANEPVLNADLWKSLHALDRARQVDWRWLKGHAGHLFNERADELASAAILEHGGADAGSGEQRSLAADAAFDAADVQALIKIRAAGPSSRWLVLLIDADNQRQIDGTEPGNANRAELRAGLELLRAVDPGRTLSVRCGDYFAKGCSEWLRGWKQRGWQTAGGSQVKNKDLWLQVDQTLGQRAVSFASLPKTGPVASELRRRLKELSS